MTDKEKKWNDGFKCGCGGPGRYYVTQLGKQVLACNKYFRCAEPKEEPVKEKTRD